MSARLTGKPVLYVIAGALGAALLGAAAMGIFIASGRYDIAAMHPHTQPVRTILLGCGILPRESNLVFLLATRA